MQKNILRVLAFILAITIVLPIIHPLGAQAVETKEETADIVAVHTTPASVASGLTLSFDLDSLPQGERSRLILEGNTTPVASIAFTSDSPKLIVDEFGNIQVQPYAIISPDGEIARISAVVYSYPEEDVIWYEGFEKNFIQHNAENRQGFNHNWNAQFINITEVSLVGGQTSRTGRFSFTNTATQPPNATLPPGAPMAGGQTASNSTVLRMQTAAPAGSVFTFWYYDPMTDIESAFALAGSNPGFVKFGAGIHNVGANDNRIAGVFYNNDAPVSNERFRGHLEYIWRPGTSSAPNNIPVWDGHANDGEGGFVPHTGTIANAWGWSDGGFRTTGVDRQYGWRQFSFVTKAANTVPVPAQMQSSPGLNVDYFPAGTYLYIDGELIPNSGRNGVRGLASTQTTIPSGFLSTNWNAHPGNANLTRQRHFIDDMYILAPGATPVRHELYVDVMITSIQHEIVLDGGPVFDRFESENPVFDFANPGDVSFRVEPNLTSFQNWSINDIVLGSGDFTIENNRITLHRSWLENNLPITPGRGVTLVPMVMGVTNGAPLNSYLEVQNNTARRFFFDSINGNDANDGLTSETAWQSLDRLSGKYFPGDEIFLVRGSIWNMDGEAIYLTGHGTPDRPINLQAYGSSPNRPIINGQGTFGHIPFYMQLAAVNTNVHFYHGAVQLIGGSNWNLSGLEVTNDCMTPAPTVGQQLRTGHRGRWGIVVINPYARTLADMSDANWRASRVDNIHISDMYVHHVNAAGEAFGGGGGTKFSGGIGFFGHINYSVVERSRVYKTDMTGIRNAIFHPSGTFGSPIHYPKDISNTVIFRNNYVSHVHGDAFVLSGGTAGSIMEHNIVHTMGRSFLHYAPSGGFGAVIDRNIPTSEITPQLQSTHNYAALWFMGASNAVAQFNTVFDTSYYCNDGQAFDIDAGSYNVVYQFNFSARNHGGTVLFMPTDQRNNTFRYNLSVHDGGFSRKAHLIYGGPTEANGGPNRRSTPHIYNNTWIIGHAPDAPVRSLFDPHGGNLDVWFENNILFSTDPNRTLDIMPQTWSNHPILPTGTIRNNIFYPEGLFPLNQLSANVNLGEGDGPFGSNLIVNPMFVGGGHVSENPAIDHDPIALGFSLIRGNLTHGVYFDTAPLDAFRLHPDSPAIGAGRVTHNSAGWAINSHRFDIPEHLPYAPNNPMVYHEVRLLYDMFGNRIDHARPNIGAYAGAPELTIGLTFGGTQSGVPRQTPLTTGQVERLFIDGYIADAQGRSLPIDKIEFDPGIHADIIEIDSDGNVNIREDAIENGLGERTVTVSATLHYFDGDDVIWFENFEDGQAPFSVEDRRGFSAWHGSIRSTSLVEGGQASRTGRYGFTIGTTNTQMQTNFPQAAPTGSRMTFWYYDPMNDVTVIDGVIQPQTTPNHVRFVAGVDIGNPGRMVGVTYGSDSASVGNGAHMYYGWRPGNVPGLGGPTGPAAGGTPNNWRTTYPVQRTEGWRRFDFITEETGSYLYVDGERIGRSQMAAGTTIPSVVIGTGWATQGQNGAQINNRHFIDDMYIIGPNPAPLRAITIQTQFVVRPVPEITITVDGGRVRLANSRDWIGEGNIWESMDTVVPGTELTVISDQPPANHVFDYWETTGITLSAHQASQSRLMFVMPENNVTFTARFRPLAPETVRFAIFSDTHIGSTDPTHNVMTVNLPMDVRLGNVSEWVLSQGVDAVLTVGDMICHGGLGGGLNRWNRLLDTIDGYFHTPNRPNPHLPQIIFGLGNHDYWGSGTVGGTENFNVATGDYNNRVVEIGGQWFIALAPSNSTNAVMAPTSITAALDSPDHFAGGWSRGFNTEGNSSNQGNTYPCLEQRRWLAGLLEYSAANRPGMPVFISLHQPLPETVWTSGLPTSSFGNPHSAAGSFFCQFPNAVVFTAHSHAPSNDPRAIWQGNFTAINSPTMYYFSIREHSTDPAWRSPGWQPAFGQNAFFLGHGDGVTGSNSPRHPVTGRVGPTVGIQLVEVTGSVVRVENYNFAMEGGLNDSVYKLQQVWTFDTANPESWNYRTDRTAGAVPPSWEITGAEISVDDITDTSIAVTFTQPTIPAPNILQEEVHSYRFTFTNLETNAVEREAWQWSDFFHPAFRSPNYTQVIGGLRPGTEYSLRIHAFSSLQAESIEYLTITFTTTGERTDPPQYRLTFDGNLYNEDGYRPENVHMTGTAAFVAGSSPTRQAIRLDRDNFINLNNIGGGETIPNTEVFDYNSSFTVAFRTNIISYRGQWGALMGNKNWAAGANNGFVFFTHSTDNTIRLNTTSVSDPGRIGGGAPNPDIRIAPFIAGDNDQWIHIAAVYDFEGGTNGLGSVSVFADGVLISTHNTNLTQGIDANMPTMLGQAANGATGLYNHATARSDVTFLMEDFVLVNVVKTAEEIAELARVEQDIDIPVDRTALQEAIALAESRIQANYTPASWAVMQEALTAARDADTDAATQEQVDAANAALRAAITGLVSDAVIFTGNNPNVLRELLMQQDVILKTAGNLGIFAHHSPFVIPEGRTLTVVTTLNIQGNAKLIVEGMLVIQEGGRVNNQGGAGGTIEIAPSGKIVNNGHVENVTNSAVINYGTIDNRARFEVRAGTTLHDCGLIVEGEGRVPLNIHRNANITRCDNCEVPD